MKPQPLPSTATAHLRAAEASAFRRAVSMLEAARGDAAPIARAEALVATGLLWDAVLAASSRPGSGLSAEMCDGLTELANAVLEEINRASPDLDFLIHVNAQILSGLASYH